MTRPANGFTLVELLVVVALIGLMAGVAVGQYQRSILKSKEAVLRENLYRTRTAIDIYYAQKGAYPNSLAALVSEDFLKQVPFDPILDRSDAWTLIRADLSDLDVTAQPGIKDIRSAAPGKAVNGTLYVDW